jgi:hypothetical protein
LHFLKKKSFISSKDKKSNIIIPKCHLSARDKNKPKTLMKILTTILFATFILLSSQGFSKTDQVKSSIPEKKDPIEETKIQSFDFQKLFSEAENYFKIAKAWKKIKCEPKTGFICTKRECNKRDTKAYLILDKAKKTITRCEDEVCESFAAEFKQNGVFFNIQSEGPIGTLIRVLGDSRYKEITTVGLDAYIANGNCEAITD